MVNEGNSKAMVASSSATGNIISSLMDSRSNVNMTPHLHDLSERQSISMKCSFANNAQLQATMSGEIRVLIPASGKRLEIRVRDVLLITALSCRVLNTRAIRRDGGDFVDSGYKRSHIVVRKSGPKFNLEESSSFRRLKGQIELTDGEEMVHAILAVQVGRKQRLSLKA